MRLAKFHRDNNMYVDKYKKICNFCNEYAVKKLVQKTKTSRTVDMPLCLHHAKTASYVLFACGVNDCFIERLKYETC